MKVWGQLMQRLLLSLPLICGNLLPADLRKLLDFSRSSIQSDQNRWSKKLNFSDPGEDNIRSLITGARHVEPHANSDSAVSDDDVTTGGGGGSQGGGSPSSTEGGSANYDNLKYSIIRIQAVSKGYNWLEPSKMESNSVGLGTGWIIHEPTYGEPIIVTNAHVVSDAFQIKVQLLVYSSERFTAKTRFICHHFDVALLSFEDWPKVQGMFQQKHVELQPLHLRRSIPPMGLRVIAMGFPLGQDLLKLSAGEVAGNQEVEGNVCIQSTAPISPGNSGGPLLTRGGAGLNGGGFEVVGINFAKATGSAENVNYVIPAWRVKQVLAEFIKMERNATGTEPAEGGEVEMDEKKKVSPDSRIEGTEQNVVIAKGLGEKKSHSFGSKKRRLLSPDKKGSVVEGGESEDVATSMAQIDSRSKPGQAPPAEKPRFAVKIPPIMMRTANGVPSIYKLDPECEQYGGVLITNMEQRSFMRDAQPPPQVGNYLFQIGNVTIDKFGQGIASDYLADQIHLENFFWMQPQLFGLVTFKTCSQAVVTTHSLDLKWKPFYEQGIRDVNEPGFDKVGSEQFGDIGIMPMTLNHINMLMHNNAAITRWLMPGLIESSRLIITSIKSGTEAEESIRAGMSMKRVNGCVVKTLSDLEAFFMPAVARRSDCDAKNAEQLLMDTGYGAGVGTINAASLAQGIGKSKFGGIGKKITDKQRKARRKLLSYMNIGQETKVESNLKKVQQGGLNLVEKNTSAIPNSTQGQTQEEAGAAVRDSAEKPPDSGEDEAGAADNIWSLETDLGVFFALPFDSTIQTQMASVAMGIETLPPDSIVARYASFIRSDDSRTSTNMTTDSVPGSQGPEQDEDVEDATTQPPAIAFLEGKENGKVSGAFLQGKARARRGDPNHGPPDSSNTGGESQSIRERELERSFKAGPLLVHKSETGELKLVDRKMSSIDI